MKSDSRHPWYVIDILLYLGLNLGCLWLLGPSRVLEIVGRISILQFVVAGLAVYRLSNIIANEKVTEPLRAPFVRKVEEGHRKIEQPLKTGFRGSFGTLIYCPSCVGLWVATILTYSYVTWPAATAAIIVIAALSGTERFAALGMQFLKKRANPDNVS